MAVMPTIHEVLLLKFIKVVVLCIFDANALTMLNLNKNVLHASFFNTFGLQGYVKK